MYYPMVCDNAECSWAEVRPDSNERECWHCPTGTLRLNEGLLERERPEHPA